MASDVEQALLDRREHALELRLFFVERLQHGMRLALPEQLRYLGQREPEGTVLVDAKDAAEVMRAVGAVRAVVRRLEQPLVDIELEAVHREAELVGELAGRLEPTLLHSGPHHNFL